MSKLKKSTDSAYMYESCGQKIKMCMAILCPSGLSDTCEWHKRWQADRSMVGAYFGKSLYKCDYYKQIVSDDKETLK